MGTGNKNGQMEQYIKVNGETIRQKVKASLLILMETIMRENGKMIRRMDKE